jgi:hypothetical protein
LAAAWLEDALLLPGALLLCQGLLLLLWFLGVGVWLEKGEAVVHVRFGVATALLLVLLSAQRSSLLASVADGTLSVQAMSCTCASVHSCLAQEHK